MTHKIHSSAKHYASLQEYIIHALEVIFISVTEGELFLVKVCDLPSEKNIWLKIISHFFLRHLPYFVEKWHIKTYYFVIYW